MERKENSNYREYKLLSKDLKLITEIILKHYPATQAIDLANHIIRSYKMGIPSSSAESFILLQKKLVIDLKLAEKLSNMVHFRNTIVHQYEKTDINIVESIIQNDLKDVVLFTEKIMEYIKGNTS